MSDVPSSLGCTGKEITGDLKPSEQQTSEEFERIRHGFGLTFRVNKEQLARDRKPSSERRSLDDEPLFRRQPLCLLPANAQVPSTLGGAPIFVNDTHHAGIDPRPPQRGQVFPFLLPLPWQSGQVFSRSGPRSGPLSALFIGSPFSPKEIAFLLQFSECLPHFSQSLFAMV